MWPPGGQLQETSKEILKNTIFFIQQITKKSLTIKQQPKIPFVDTQTIHSSLTHFEVMFDLTRNEGRNKYSNTHGNILTPTLI